MKDKIKILIVDDHAIARMGLASILGTKPDLDVVGEAADGQEALDKVQTLAPDMIIMDLLMPGMDGATATALIHDVRPASKILILTTYGTADGIAHALEAGASGAVMKNIDYEELIDTIRAVASGKRVIAPEIRSAFRDSPPIPELTRRQHDILLSMSRGLTDADIAKELGLTPNSVREHITTIFNKLGAANKAEAVAIALRKHLLKA